MPVYKVIEVGSGGSGGGGCLFTAVLLAIGLFALADTCDSSGPQSPQGISVEEGPASASSDQARSELEPETDPSGPSSENGTAEPPKEDLPERDVQSRYINDWVLRRLRSEDGPAVVIAMPGETPFERHLVEALRRQEISAQTGLLKEGAFEADGVFQRLAGGDGEMLRRLGLARLSGHLVVCRLGTSRARKTRDGYTTEATLSVRLVPMSGGRPAAREFKAPGGGFSPEGAKEQALQRVRSDFLSSSLISRLTRQ